MKRLTFKVNIDGKKFWYKHGDKYIYDTYHSDNEYLNKLILDQVQNKKINFLDYVTGRCVFLGSILNGFILYPGREIINEEDIVSDNSDNRIKFEYDGALMRDLIYILDNYYDEYLSISEDFYYYNYFCKLINENTHQNEISCDELYKFENEYKEGLKKLDIQGINMSNYTDKKMCKTLNKVVTSCNQR